MSRPRWDRSFLALFGLVLALLLGAGGVLALPTSQGELDFAALDAYVATERVRLGIPGLALGIVRDDQIAHLQGFGVADSAGRPVTPQTPFYLGSLTKSFTALAVMQLVETGRIDLDAPVQTYLPWFQLADKEASARITVRNLLNHTSGISTRDADRHITSRQGLEDVVRGLGDLPLSRPVGTAFQYGNVNYDIAGLIVEQVSGQSYGEYVAQHIFEPLDMRHAYASRAAALADGLSDGHRYMFGHVFRAERDAPPSQLPSGSLIASVEDMAHYAIAQLNEGRYGDSAVLSPQGMAELHAPAIPMGGGDAHYAMGWAVGTLDGTDYVGHSGLIYSFRSEIYLLPREGWGVIVLANATGFEQITQLDQLGRQVVAMLHSRPPTPVYLPLQLRFLYWTVMVMPLLLIVGVAYSWRYRSGQGLVRTAIIVVLYATVGVLWLFGVPRLTGIPVWDGTRINYPELSYALVLGAALGIGWAVVYAAASLVRRRST